MLVVACNSAAAAALDHAAATASTSRSIGVIEPGVRAARRVTRTGRVGVIGTVGTIASGAYQRAAAELDRRRRAHVRGVPGLRRVRRGRRRRLRPGARARRAAARAGARRRRRHARARLHALPAARPYDRRRDGPRCRARVERRRDRVRGARRSLDVHGSACRSGTRSTHDVRHERRRRDVPAARRARSSVPRSSAWRRGRGADGARVLGLVRRAGGRRVQRLPRCASGDTAIWVDCGNGTFGHLQEHVDGRGPHRGRASRTGTPTTASTSTACTCCCATASSAQGLPVYAPEGRREACSRCSSATGATRSTGASVGDGDTRRRSATSTCGSRAPTTRRPRTRSRPRTTASGSSTPPTPGPDGASSAFGAGADLVLSEATYLHDDIRAPIHLSARQAGEAAREARRAAADAHPPVADARPGSRRRGRLGGVRRRRSRSPRRTSSPHI